MRDKTAPEPEVIIPNLHWNFSGVTATNRMVAPKMAALARVSWMGPDRPDGVAGLAFRDFLRLRARRAADGPAPVWHARRNNEMIAGLLFRWLGWRLNLVFTSARGGAHTWITHFLVRRMDAVIATSDEAAAALRRRSTIIHHGVDTALYRPPADRSAAFAAAGLPGRRGIGCFGRVRHQKGTDVFVEAMCRLLPKYQEFTAIVVGATGADDRRFLSGLKARAAACGVAGRVHFLGEQPASDLPAWFQRLTIYAFTSRREGFGLTLVEAMASGAAVVAARAGAAEFVIEHGETGFLVPPGDVEELVSALEPLMRDPARAEEIGRRARMRVEAVHAVENEAAAIVDVYRRLWARSPC